MEFLSTLGAQHNLSYLLRDDITVGRLSFLLSSQSFFPTLWPVCVGVFEEGGKGGGKKGLGAQGGLMRVYIHQLLSLTLTESV